MSSPNQSQASQSPAPVMTSDAFAPTGSAALSHSQPSQASARTLSVAPPTAPAVSGTGSPKAGSPAGSVSQLDATAPSASRSAASAATVSHHSAHLAAAPAAPSVGARSPAPAPSAHSAVAPSAPSAPAPSAPSAPAPSAPSAPAPSAHSAVAPSAPSAPAPLAAAPAYVSQLEGALLNAANPLSSSETEEIEVNGERGVHLNRAEIAAWKGALSLDKYPIYKDPCPQIIRKKAQNAEIIQELSIKYLRPKLAAPGPITIRQQPNRNVEPAPPVIIRQQAQNACGGGAKVFREQPPCLPKAPPAKCIVIPGKLNPPPPRKVIIEKLVGFPAKPDNISVERWVNPEPIKRQVKFIPAAPSACVPKPRNLIIEWEATNVSIKENFKNLGVHDADPSEYRNLHKEFVSADQLPEFALKAQVPSGHKLIAASQTKPLIYELEGDVQALALIDLDKEGLGEYKEYLTSLGIQFKPDGNARDEFDMSVQYCPDNCPEPCPPPPPPPADCVCPPPPPPDCVCPPVPAC